jgi:hypothetical protein
MRKRVLDTLSRDEIQHLEDAAQTERDKLIVRILADTGLRLGELLAPPTSAWRAAGTCLGPRGLVGMCHVQDKTSSFPRAEVAPLARIGANCRSSSAEGRCCPGEPRRPVVAIYLRESRGR